MNQREQSALLRQLETAQDPHVAGTMDRHVTADLFRRARQAIHEQLPYREDDVVLVIRDLARENGQEPLQLRLYLLVVDPVGDGRYGHVINDVAEEGAPPVGARVYFRPDEVHRVWNQNMEV